MADSTSIYSTQTIQWFPGHMTKAERMMEENMKLVDGVCEILDARIPESSRNPDVSRLTGGKPRLILLNRADLADPAITSLWKRYYSAQGWSVLETDARTGKGLSGFSSAVRELLSDKLTAYAEKGQAQRPLRLMVLGIPNVGKSTLINKIAGRKVAAAGDKPGVTRGKQWVNIDRGLELLDTPGILWPKFDNPAVGEALALTGAVKQELLDVETLGAGFLARLSVSAPEVIVQRYKFTPQSGQTGYDLLETAARKRGFLLSGGVCDTERMAETLLKEYRDGKLGRISLEIPPKEVKPE